MRFFTVINMPYGIDSLTFLPVGLRISVWSSKAAQNYELVATDYRLTTIAQLSLGCGSQELGD